MLGRVENLEAASLNYTTFVAGENIQTAKFVSVVSGIVYHTDVRYSNRAAIVGIAIESASVGDIVRVQTNGYFQSSMATFIGNPNSFAAYNGNTDVTVVNDATFVCKLGVALTTTEIIINIAQPIGLIHG